MGGPPILSVLALVFNALVWGLSWWPFRQFGGAGLHPLWTTVFIYGFAVFCISLTRPQAWRELVRSPALWVIAVASGMTKAAFNWGVAQGDVVRVVLLFYLMPLWSLLLARLVLKERLGLAALARVALALGGAVAVLLPADGSLPGPSTLTLPDALGLIGGFCFALNNVLLRREADRSGAARALAMFAGGVLVAGALASVLAQEGRLPWPSLPAFWWWLPLLAMALLFLLSNLCLQYGAARLPAQTSAVVMLTEVPVAAVSAWALGGGTLNVQTLLGGLCIVAAAVLAALKP